MKYFFSFIALLFIAGCSSNEEKPEIKTYSAETNRAFEMIERGGSYYLKSAPTPTRPVQVKKITPRPTEKIVVDEHINYQEQPTTKISTPIPTRSKKTPKVDERLVEINQNLAFYCMKHRKDPRFGDSEAKCMSFVDSSLKECQKSHQVINSKLLGCIQKKLKNR